MATTSAHKKHSLQQIKTRVIDSVFRDASELSRLRRFQNSAIKLCLMVSRDFVENLGQLRAMALAFKTLLSLAPFLAVIFSILKAFGVHNRIEPVLAEALAPLGDEGRQVTDYLIDFVDRMSVGALGSIGLVTLFFTVMSLIATIEEAFNFIWRVKTPRSLTRQFSDYLSVLLVGPVLVFAALTVTATLQSNTFVKALTSVEPFGTAMLVMLRLLPYVTLWGAFTFMYVFVPNTRVKLRSAAIGGLVAAILWETSGWAFAKFVASSTSYYAIYSSFAILLLFLLWLQIGWLVVLLGAQVAYAHQNLHLYQDERRFSAEGHAARETLGLLLMFHIARHFHEGLKPLNVAELAVKLHLPATAIRECMQQLQRNQLVLPAADQETFVLARDPERISIKEILDSIRGSAEVSATHSPGAREEEEVYELLREVDRSMAATLHGRSLRSLVAARKQE